MWANRFVIAALLGVAGSFVGTSSAHAQGYLYGYYYPDRQKWVSYDERPIVQYNVTPEQFEAFTHQRLSHGYAPTTSYYLAPAPAVPTIAGIEVMVPDSQARVWFDGKNTTSIGTDRFYQTPSLATGSTYTYRLKASWMRGGNEITREQTISVTPGKTTVVEFTP